MFSLYPVCHEVQSVLADFFLSLEKGRMWWYNTLGDIEGIISHHLWLDPITSAHFQLRSNLLALKRKKSCAHFNSKNNYYFSTEIHRVIDRLKSHLTLHG